MRLLIAFGIANAIAVGISTYSKRERRDHVVAALVLFAGWAAFNLMHIMRMGEANSVLDVAIFYSVFSLWLHRQSQWKTIILAALIAQMFWHVVYQVALTLGHNIGYSYQAALNMLFVCQLIAVSWDGAKRGLDTLYRMFSVGRFGFLLLQSSMANSQWTLTLRTRSIRPAYGSFYAARLGSRR